MRGEDAKHFSDKKSFRDFALELEMLREGIEQFGDLRKLSESFIGHLLVSGPFWSQARSLSGEDGEICVHSEKRRRFVQMIS